MVVRAGDVNPETGLVFKQLKATIDDRTTILCLNAAGQIRPVDEPYDTLAGPVMLPPFHIHCRSVSQPWTPGMVDNQRRAANAEVRGRSPKQRSYYDGRGGYEPPPSPYGPPYRGQPWDPTRPTSGPTGAVKVTPDGALDDIADAVAKRSPGVPGRKSPDAVPFRDRLAGLSDPTEIRDTVADELAARGFTVVDDDLDGLLDVLRSDWLTRDLRPQEILDNLADVLESATNTYDRLLSEYPHVAEGLEEFRLHMLRFKDKPSDYLAAQGRRTYEQAAGKSSGLFINPAEAIRAFSDNPITNATDWDGVFTHEFGHLVQELAGFKSSSGTWASTAYREGVRGPFNVTGFGDLKGDDVLAALNSAFDDTADLVSTVSAYAGHNQQEAWAELFALRNAPPGTVRALSPVERAKVDRFAELINTAMGIVVI